MDPAELKIVWDVTVGDEAVFEDKMGLVRHTAEVTRKRGMIPKFVVVVHGPATRFTVGSLIGTSFERDKLQRLPDIHRLLSEMHGEGTAFVQCSVPMQRNDVALDNIMPFIEVSENAFFDLAVLQSENYAYIPLLAT